MMRRVLVILFGIISSVFGKERDYVPEIFPEERYQHIWSRKPFSPPTPLAPIVQAEGIEQQYALSGLLKIGGEWTAFVQDRKSLKRHCVSGTVNEIGLQLVSVKESASSEPSTATIRSGQQTGIIRFDPAVMKAVDGSLGTIHGEPSYAKPKSPSAGNSPASSPNGEHHSTSPIQTINANLLDFNK